MKNWKAYTVLILGLINFYIMLTLPKHKTGEFTVTENNISTTIELTNYIEPISATTYLIIGLMFIGLSLHLHKTT